MEFHFHEPKLPPSEDPLPPLPTLPDFPLTASQSSQRTQVPSTPQMDTIVLESASDSSQLISTPLSERVAQLIGCQTSKRRKKAAVFGSEDDGNDESQDSLPFASPPPKRAGKRIPDDSQDIELIVIPTPPTKPQRKAADTIVANTQEGGDMEFQETQLYADTQPTIIASMRSNPSVQLNRSQSQARLTQFTQPLEIEGDSYESGSEDGEEGAERDASVVAENVNADLIESENDREKVEGADEIGKEYNVEIKENVEQEKDGGKGGGKGDQEAAVSFGEGSKSIKWKKKTNERRKVKEKKAIDEEVEDEEEKAEEDEQGGKAGVAMNPRRSSRRRRSSESSEKAPKTTKIKGMNQFGRRKGHPEEIKEKDAEKKEKEEKKSSGEIAPSSFHPSQISGEIYEREKRLYELENEQKEDEGEKSEAEEKEVTASVEQTERNQKEEKALTAKGKRVVKRRREEDEEGSLQAKTKRQRKKNARASKVVEAMADSEDGDYRMEKANGEKKQTDEESEQTRVIANRTRKRRRSYSESANPSQDLSNNAITSPVLERKRARLRANLGEGKTSEKQAIKVPAESLGLKPSPAILAAVDFSQFLAKEDLRSEMPAVNEVEDGEELPVARWFHGVTFVLTSLAFKAEEEAKNVIAEYQIPDLDETLKRVIRKHGGTESENVVAHTAAVRLRNRKSNAVTFPPCILIAPCALRTKKFLTALALRIPCVHYSYLLNSDACGRRLPLEPFLLPSGSHKEQQSDVVLHPPVPVDALLFFDQATNDSYRVELVGSSEYTQEWSPLLYAAGAKVVQRLLTIEGRIDFIICEGQPSEALRERAVEIDKPLLTTEWLIQSLIADRLLEPQQNTQFTV